jgi:hypothetical protein
MGGWVNGRLVASLVLVTAACSHPPSPLAISVVPSTAKTRAVIRVSGLSSDELTSLNNARFDEGAWQALLRVAVAGGAADVPPLAGRYAVTGAALEFAPLFPFDAGREYSVLFDPSRLPSPRADAIVRATVSLPAAAAVERTTVVRMLPTSDVLPENLLRVYLEFSGPMSRENGRDYLKLIDENGREVTNAFLALDVDFWSPDLRRYTIFFDPGRVKRGILPNDQFGRALKAGHRFTLAVDPRWRDAAGQPLAVAFTRSFQAGPIDMAPIRIADWQIRPPAAHTRSSLTVAFPKPLDHGLLQRAIGVAQGGGSVIAGDITITANEREWHFTPAAPWAAGAYELVVLSILEDPAGNRIGRPFDIDAFDRIDTSGSPERTVVPFVVK